MARNPVTIDELASQILGRVDHDLKKTASVAYTSEVGKTELGRMMSKVAQELRTEANRPLSWDDLSKYRGQNGR